MRLLVEGIRTEKSYGDIRTLLKKNSDNASGKSNQLLFPDDPEYRSRIVEKVKTPFELNSKVMVKNSAGQYENYNIGQQ